MDIAPRMPSRNAHTENQQVQLRSNTGNAASSAAKRGTGGPIGQAAGNLGQAIRAEIQQSQNTAAGNQPNRVRINESANQTFAIPTRTEVLTDTLIEVSSQVKQALQQHPEKFDSKDWKSASKLASTIASLKLDLQKDAPLSSSESRQITKGMHKVLKNAENLIQIAKSNGNANTTAASRADEAPRAPSRR